MSNPKVNGFLVVRKPLPADRAARKATITAAYLEILAIPDELERSAAGIEFVRSLGNSDTYLLGEALEERKNARTLAPTSQYAPEPEDGILYDECACGAAVCGKNHPHEALSALDREMAGE